MTYRFIPFLLAFLFTAGLFAQQDLYPCGTQDGRVPWLRAYQQNPDAYERSGNTLYVPLTIYIVGTDAGTGYFSERALFDAFCTLNNDFAESNIQFYIKGNLRYLDNTSYYDHNWEDGLEMMQFHRVWNTLNCYIVDSPAGNCGYSRYDVGISMAKSCMGIGDHTWAHEVGHFLSLPHPFFGWEGYEHDYSQPAPSQIDNRMVEKMDGSNCNHAADGFCDTPADYLNFRWTCDTEGQSTLVQHDPDSVAFSSDGTLIMSYSNDACAARFSTDQMAAMEANVLSEKQAYLNQDPILDPIEFVENVAIQPAPEEVVDVYDLVEFSWEPMPNATHYWLEISPISSFAVVFFRYTVEGTSFVTDELKSDKKYYWRVRAYNAFNTCPIYSEKSSFETGLVSSTPTIEAISSWNIFPNPSVEGQTVEMSLNADETLDLEVSIVDVTGKVLKNFQWATAFGQNKVNIATEDLTAGLYFVQLRSEKGTLSRKMVIGN